MDETIATVGEFELIRRFFAPLGGAVAAGMPVLTGIGDDAAVLAVPRTQHLLTTVDTLVEGVHFASTCDPFRVGCKALRVNLSDLAAMGATPHWYLLSLALPSATPVAWVEAFARGLQTTAEAFALTLIGGDTVGTPGGIVITVTVLGLVGQGRAILRSGAQVGDVLFVSGTVGDAALGLAWSRGQLAGVAPEDASFLRDRLDLPEPRLALGKMLQDAALAHAAIDLSDGLIADLGHLGVASGIEARIDLERVPLSDAARRVIDGREGEMLPGLLAGGEDYELAFAAPAGARPAIMEIARRLALPITEIGTCAASKPGVVVSRGGAPMVIDRGGWSHF
ncbi:MAG: thiamine-phosphate kinase [Magnetococcales bacterium]|nr:thiamine-phosphate kinase [Magnetococcales bacterium]